MNDKFGYEVLRRMKCYEKNGEYMCRRARANYANKVNQAGLFDRINQGCLFVMEFNDRVGL